MTVTQSSRTTVGRARLNRAVGRSHVAALTALTALVASASACAIDSGSSAESTDSTSQAVTIVPSLTATVPGKPVFQPTTYVTDSVAVSFSGTNFCAPNPMFRTVCGDTVEVWVEDTMFGRVVASTTITSSNYVASQFSGGSVGGALTVPCDLDAPDLNLAV